MDRLADVVAVLLVEKQLIDGHGKLENPYVESISQTVVVASAGLLLAVVIPLARDAMTDFLTVAIAVATALTLLSEIDTLHSWCGRYFLLRCGHRMTALMCLLAEYTSHPSDFMAMEPGVLGDASLCHAG